ncbi:MAG: hypothetical protein WCW77_05160 [Patescibacteria group bacterium]|jgi:hypothetical protein
MNGENSNNKQLEELMERNLQLTEEIHKMTKGIKSYINFQKVMSIIYLLIIVLPIIAGLIFLPPLLGNMIGQYQSLLGGESSNLGSDFLKAVNPSDVRNVSPQLKNIMDNQ